MDDRASIPHPDTVAWLLEGDPSVRFFTLTGLLGAAPDAPEVQEARRAIMTEGPVPQSWPSSRRTGTSASATASTRPSTAAPSGRCLILAELGADGADARVGAACEAVLRDSQDPDSGGFG